MTKKEIIFNIYSQNLSWVKNNIKIRFEPDFVDSCICPLCFKVFPREALFINTEAELTLDHNPPKSLGGIETVLTCRECNSRSGHLIDNHLLKRLEEKDVLNLTPNAKKRITIKKDGKNTNAELKIDNSGILSINVDNRKTNPYHSEIFFNKLRTEQFDGFKFNFSFKIESLGKHAEAGLLKIAYLKAFRFFGNGFLVHPFLHIIRNKILHPEEETITEPLGIEFSSVEKPLGIGIISEPKELQSFLVCFELMTKSRKHYFSIMLPGFTSPGLDIYNNLKKLNKSAKVNFKIHILDNVDYLSKETSAFAAHHLWKDRVNS